MRKKGREVIAKLHTLTLEGILALVSFGKMYCKNEIMNEWNYSDFIVRNVRVTVCDTLIKLLFEITMQ